MKLNQAIEMIDKLHKERLSHSEIARRLERAGFKSERTQRPLTALAVGYHIRRLKDAEPAAITQNKPVPSQQGASKVKNPSPRKVQIVQEILAMDIDLRLKCESAVNILLS